MKLVLSYLPSKSISDLTLALDQPLGHSVRSGKGKAPCLCVSSMQRILLIPFHLQENLLGIFILFCFPSGSALGNLSWQAWANTWDAGRSNPGWLYTKQVHTYLMNLL